MLFLLLILYPANGGPDLEGTIYLKNHIRRQRPAGSYHNKMSEKFNIPVRNQLFR